MKSYYLTVTIPDYEKFLKDFLVDTIVEQGMIFNKNKEEIVNRTLNKLTEFTSRYHSQNIAFHIERIRFENKGSGHPLSMHFSMSVLLDVSDTEIEDSYFAKLTGSVNPEEYARFIALQLSIEMVFYANAESYYATQYTPQANDEEDLKTINGLVKSIKDAQLFLATYKWLPILWEYFCCRENEDLFNVN